MKKRASIPLKPIFSGHNDYNRTAFLNWRMDDSPIQNLLAMANGFMSSSINLAKLCIKDNKDKKADILIFPILTNANHGIELYLKALNWILNQLINSDRKIEGKHNLDQIYRTVKSKIRQIGVKDDIMEFEKETMELKAYLAELVEKVLATPKDDKMDFSRYPFSDKYENHFFVGRIGNVEVDMENLVNRFELIMNNLESLTEFYYYIKLKHDY